LSLLKAIRVRQSRSRFLVAACGVVWLSVVLSPCAMAHGNDPSSMCPDCPTAVRSEQGHRSMSLDRMPEQRISCGHPMVGCATPDDINHQARDHVTDPPPVAWITHCADDFLNVAHATKARSASVTSEPARLAGASPPLNVLYCVYLN